MRLNTRLSLLDRSRTRVGEPDSAAPRNTMLRARWAEAAGYQRFWVAEHHAVPGIASGSPPVLIAAVAGATERIRVGSGGVMLPNHQPLVVAEQFALLDALHPGRIDLGVGHSLGFTAPVRAALRHDQADTFAADLAELRSFLDGRAPVTSRPRPDRALPLFVLATGRGLTVAGDAGLPAVVGGPALWSARLPELLADYRARAERAGARPYLVVALDVLIADSESAARELALPEAWALAYARTHGEFPPLQPPDPGRALSARQREIVRGSLAHTVHGDPDTVSEQLREILARTGADELLVSGSTFDRAALRESDLRLAELVRPSHLPTAAGDRPAA